MSPDLKALRAINRTNVLNIIFSCGPVSRVRIAGLTGLRKPTVSSIENYRIYGLIDVKLWSTHLAVCDLSGQNIKFR